MKTIFLRALEASDKEAVLRAAIREPEAELGRRRFEIDATSFSDVPRSPFAYWVGDSMRQLFTRLPPLEAEGRTAKQGLATADDFRFVRGWWEIGQADRTTWSRWRYFAKGGAFSRFYSDVLLMLEWDSEGAILKAKVVAEHGNAGKRIYNEDCFFRPGVTWSRRTQGGLSFRVMPAGCIFADKGPAVLVERDGSVILLALLAVVNAAAYRALVDLQMAFGSYEVGVIQRTPFPRLEPADQARLACHTRRAWALKRSLDTRIEISHAFTLPAQLQVAGATPTARGAAWAERVRAETKAEPVILQPGEWTDV